MTVIDALAGGGGGAAGRSLGLRARGLVALLGAAWHRKALKPLKPRGQRAGCAGMVRRDVAAWRQH